MKIEKNILKILLVSLSSFCLSSCSTYLIPIESFKQQFDGIDSASLKEVKVIGPMGERYFYPANSIKTIQCVDKNGQPKELKNKPSIEIRFTYGGKNKKTVFYFDRVYLNDTLVIGSQSRFIQSMEKEISINKVTKIEVQDGRKKFRYAND